MIHSFAQPAGGQKIEELGGFGLERQRNIDEEVLKESERFITDAAKTKEPFLVCHTTARMHYRTNLNDRYRGITGMGNVHAGGMVELDDNVGSLLDLLDKLGVADNTLGIFSTDNGPALNSWPDGGMTPLRGEKGVGGYEGGFREPALARWPGKAPAGVGLNERMTMEDWIPTIMAELGQTDVKEDLLSGSDVGGRIYEVHPDGYDQTPLIGSKGPSNREEFFSFTENIFHGMRYGDWKFLFTARDRWFNGGVVQPTTTVITRLDLVPFERTEGTRGFDDRKFTDSFKDYRPGRRASHRYGVDRRADDVHRPAGAGSSPALRGRGPRGAEKNAD